MDGWLKKRDNENEMKTNSSTQRYLEEPVLNTLLTSTVSFGSEAHSTQKQTVTKMNSSSNYILHKHALVVNRGKTRGCLH
jgi:hypothetical protein